MRLLVITAFYPPHHSGGYEMRCKDVVDGLVKRGHDVLVITNHCPSRHCKLHPKPEPVFRTLHQRSEASSVVSQILNDIRDLRYIDKKVKEYRPDIIYLWHVANLSNGILPYFSDQNIQIVYDEGGSGLIYLAKISRNGLYFYRNENDSKSKRLLKQCIYRMANILSLGLIRPEWAWPRNMRIYFNCQSSLKHAKDMGAPVDHASVIHSGIEIAKFSFLARDHVNSPIRILIPGRIKPPKGTIDSIDLVKELIAKKHSIRLTLVGEIQSEDYYKEIIGRIENNGLRNAVEYLPMTSHDVLARLYQEADICFFPSYFLHGFSRVPLEAMASGCVVIAYGNEGTKEIVRDRETGFIVCEGDFVSAAARIEDVWNDPAFYRKITQAARWQIEREHTMDRYVDAIENFLKESLANHAAGQLKTLP